MGDEFMDTYISFGFVGKLTYKELDEFKEHIKNFEGNLRVIYQKTSPGNLWLVDKRPEDEPRPSVTNVTNR
ncbi:MAG: hypothetical protein WC455_30335 [Dehalococcoidia bacterium]|jgi:hypothetical protein